MFEKFSKIYNNFLAKFIKFVSLKTGHMAMHAYQIGPADTTSFAWDGFTRPVLEQGRMLWGRQPFCPHFSTAYLLVRLHSSIWIHGYGVIGCQMLMLTSLDICYWVANVQHRGGCGRWDLTLDAGWQWLLTTSATPIVTSCCGTLLKRQRSPSAPILRRFLA